MCGGDNSRGGFLVAYRMFEYIVGSRENLGPMTFKASFHGWIIAYFVFFRRQEISVLCIFT